jgi:hypothetical protein
MEVLSFYTPISDNYYLSGFTEARLANYAQRSFKK